MHRPKTLPCFPCPHRAACCNFGSSLTDEEAEQVRAAHGDDAVRYVVDEWRTAVVDGRCVFLAENTCDIYKEPYYPAICRGFPWIDGQTGSPYDGDPTICPELAEEGGP